MSPVQRVRCGVPNEIRTSILGPALPSTVRMLADPRLPLPCERSERIREGGRGLGTRGGLGKPLQKLLQFISIKIVRPFAALVEDSSITGEDIEPLRPRVV